MIPNMNDILRYLDNVPNLMAAYLFGSACKGTMKKTSDIDIALLFSETHENTIDLLQLMVDLSRISGRNVDIIIMNTASPLLYHEILATGKLIYERDRLFRILSVVRNRRLYFDYQYIHSIYMKGMRARYGKQEHH